MRAVALRTDQITAYWTRDLWQLGGGVAASVRYHRGMTLEDVVAAVVPAAVRAASGTDVVVSVNGEVRGPDLWRLPLFGGDHVTWRPRMGDPATIGTLILISLATTLVSAAVQYLIAPPTKPRKNRGDESSPTATWRGTQVSFGAGQPIPNGFGELMVAGHVIQSFRLSTQVTSTGAPVAVGSDTLYLLVSLGYGPHHNLGGYEPPGGADQFDNETAAVFPSGYVLIDDQPLTVDLYPNARFWWRNGQEQQAPIPGFGALRTEHVVDIDFSVPPEPRQTRLTAAPISGLASGTVTFVQATNGFFVQDEALFDPGGVATTKLLQQVSPDADVTGITQAPLGPGLNVAISLDTISGMSAGEVVSVNQGGSPQEYCVIVQVNQSPPWIVVAQLTFSYPSGVPVIRYRQFRVPGNLTGIPADAIVQRIGRPGQRDVVYRTTAESTQLSSQAVYPSCIIRIEFDALYTLSGGNAQTFTVDFEVSERLEGDTIWSNRQPYRVVDKKTTEFPIDLHFTSTLRSPGKKLELLIHRVTFVDGAVGALNNQVSNSRVASVIESVVSTYTVIEQGNPVTRTDEHRYPFHALVAMKLPAIEAFAGSRPPTIRFKTKLTWCPDVIDAGGGVYTFVPWQTLARADRWSDNPARIALMIHTEELWGMGDTYTAAQLNLREFYRWKIYCAQSVSNGAGGTKPRFQWNGNFDEIESRQDAILAVGAVGRAVFMEVSGLVTPVFQHPDDPGAGLPLPLSGVYTETNIIGAIKRQYLPVNNPPDVINVEYQNQDRGFDRDVQPVRDPQARRRPYRLRGRGSRPQTLNLAGCTSTPQAIAEGRFRHNILRLIECSYEITVGRDAAQSVPGQRIALSHSAFRWFGKGNVLTNVSQNSGPSYPPANVLRLLDSSNFAAGDPIQVDPPGVAENYTVQFVDVDAGTITLTSNLLTDHTQATAHKVVNLGLGSNGVVNGTCGLGQPDPTILIATSIPGVRPGDELWINPGGPRDERHWVDTVISSTQFRLRNLMTHTHTAAQGDLVRCLSFGTYTGRTVAAGTATDSVAIDQPVDVPSTPGFVAIAVRQRDGAVKQARVTDPAGSYAAGFVFTAPGLASTHNADAPVALGIETRMLQDVRVAEAHTNPDLTHTLVCLDYDQAVFDDSPDGLVEPAQDGGHGFGPESIQDVDVVSAVGAEQRSTLTADGTGSIDVRWSKFADQTSGSVVVWYREIGASAWIRAGSSRTERLAIDDLDQGKTYEVTVTPQSSDGLGFVEPAAGQIATVTVLERGARRIGGV